ncbi:hypothetical protein L3Q82_015396 [Scortum barcoo]|uniref:Uncharacterized protein n=1 Tax=Scortum barcoo TaxID=214431 RepID=A0ACB8VTT4_9TELE|nr:hypothetical protein L3Q82_015396 [Scortum barcoo]
MTSATAHCSRTVRTRFLPIRLFPDFKNCSGPLLELVDSVGVSLEDASGKTLYRLVVDGFNYIVFVTSETYEMFWLWGRGASSHPSLPRGQEGKRRLPRAREGLGRVETPRLLGRPVEDAGSSGSGRAGGGRRLLGLGRAGGGRRFLGLGARPVEDAGSSGSGGQVEDAGSSGSAMIANEHGNSLMEKTIDGGETENMKSSKNDNMEDDVSMENVFDERCLSINA